jgi:hypothetical protein
VSRADRAYLRTCADARCIPANGKVRFETVDYDPYSFESPALGAISLNGAICFLQVYRTPKRVYAIAGSTEGSIGVWDA